MATRKPASPRQALKQYRAKRDFKKSPEPSGVSAPKPRKSRKTAQRIFTVQKHLASHLHYDLRLEHNRVLLSWAVPKGPSLNPKDKRLAMRVEDHPYDYAEFEGVIPEGYGAGIVMLWDKGTWTPESPNVDDALESGELKFSLDGTKLKGSWVLVRTGGRGGGDNRAWLLIKHKDQWAGPVDVTQVAPLSVKTFGDFPDILGADKPGVWKSHRPGQGAAGAMLDKVVEQAAAIKSARATRKKKKKS